MRLPGQSIANHTQLFIYNCCWLQPNTTVWSIKTIMVSLKLFRGWYLFDTGREVCDDFKDVVGLSKVFADVGFICTYDSDGQARACISQTEVCYFSAVQLTKIKAAFTGQKQSSSPESGLYSPGKGCLETISSGSPSSLPRARTSSLWKSFNGSITFP